MYTHTFFSVAELLHVPDHYDVAFCHGFEVTSVPAMELFLWDVTAWCCPTSWSPSVTLLEGEIGHVNKRI